MEMADVEVSLYIFFFNYFILMASYLTLEDLQFLFFIISLIAATFSLVKFQALI